MKLLFILSMIVCNACYGQTTGSGFVTGSNQTFVIVEKDASGNNKYKQIGFPTDECEDGGYYADDIHIYKDSIVVFSTRKTGIFNETHGSNKKKCIYQIIKGEFVKVKEWKSTYTPPIKIEKAGYLTYEDGTIVIDAATLPTYSPYLNPLGTLKLN